MLDVHDHVTSYHVIACQHAYLGLYSLSCKTSYRKISWSLEAARFRFKLFQSLWNLAGTSATALPRCLSNFRAILPLQHPISRLRDFTRFGGKTSYRLVNRGPEADFIFSVARSQMRFQGCIFDSVFSTRKMPLYEVYFLLEGPGSDFW